MGRKYDFIIGGILVDRGMVFAEKQLQITRIVKRRSINGVNIPDFEFPMKIGIDKFAVRNRKDAVRVGNILKNKFLECFDSKRKCDSKIDAAIRKSKEEEKNGNHIKS